MKATNVTPTLTQLTRLRFVNAFLVREDDGFTLVDTTMGGAADGCSRRHATAGAPIRRIALTHGHGDHVGGLDALKAARSGRRGADARARRPHPRRRAGRRGQAAGSWPKLETKPDVRLRGGDRVGSLEVVASPGHTPGHVAFLDTRDRTLIAGDVFTTYGKAAVTNHFYWRFPLAAMATWDKQQDLDSARKLRALEPSLLAVGHGPAVRDPAAAMDAAIERAST